MTFSHFLAVSILGGYMVGGGGLWLYVSFWCRKRHANELLPSPWAFFGAAIWAYAFSSRHRLVGDWRFSALVIYWRITILLLPIGALAFLMGS